MSEITMDSGPIFVDVGNNPQCPITYSQLIQAADLDSREESDASKILKDASGVASDNSLLVEASGAIEQESNCAETDAVNACIKIEKRRLKCPECKRFTCETEEKLLRHIRRIHRGENPFQCSMCEYSTYNKAVFEEHVRVHQGIKPFKCSHCDYRSASKKNAKKHELIHRSDNPLKCKKCDFIGKNSQSFNAHMSRLHDTTDPNEVYACEICKSVFPNRHKKNTHVRKNKRNCAKCKFVTCSRSILNSHYKHNHGMEMPVKKKPHIFKCALCEWSSGHKPRILLHLIHHPNQFIEEDVIDVSVLRNCGIVI